MNADPTARPWHHSIPTGRSALRIEERDGEPRALMTVTDPDRATLLVAGAWCVAGAGCLRAADAVASGAPRPRAAAIEADEAAVRFAVELEHRPDDVVELDVAPAVLTAAAAAARARCGDDPLAWRWFDAIITDVARFACAADAHEVAA